MNTPQVSDKLYIDSVLGPERCELTMEGVVLSIVDQSLYTFDVPDDTLDATRGTPRGGVRWDRDTFRAGMN